MQYAGPIGETGLPDSAYSSPEEGPFECSTCVHFMNVDHPECWHPMVIEDAKTTGKLKIDEDGHALVMPEGCCKFHRLGETITQAKANRLMKDSLKSSRAARVLGGEK